jgi:hypothetical protein
LTYICLQIYFFKILYTRVFSIFLQFCDIRDTSVTNLPLTAKSLGLIFLGMRRVDITVTTLKYCIGAKHKRKLTALMNHFGERQASFFLNHLVDREYRDMMAKLEKESQKEKLNNDKRNT